MVIDDDDDDDKAVTTVTVIMMMMMIIQSYVCRTKHPYNNNINNQLDATKTVY